MTSPSATAPNLGAAAALRSVHTANLPALFEELRISLVVSTYQAGKLILVRSNRTALNTHFVAHAKPMGVARHGARLTVGGASAVTFYCDVPAFAGDLEVGRKHDACFVPRSLHVSGDIDLHEMSYDASGELWVVNTRFCCLCTFDPDHSFTPRWRPSFVSGYAPEDRCHLNGLGMVDGRPKYVTALGRSDTAGGWRANKANGGLLMEIEGSEILLEGLSMPHSPRWHRDRLWFLESGQGSLATVDLSRRTWTPVAQMPGFTRGIDFAGPLAFIGLSQVRESAVFSGIPLVKRLKERVCGVWVVNVETGQTIGYLRFEAGVQEIFAVQVLHGIQLPEVLDWTDARVARTYVLPDAAIAEVAAPTKDTIERSAAAHFERAHEHRRKQALADAIVELRTCLDLDSTFPNARYDLCAALVDARRDDEAAVELLRLVEEEPERAEAHNLLGQLDTRRGRHFEARAHYQRAIDARSDNAEAHFNLGVSLLRAGNFVRGLPEYEWRWQTGKLTPLAAPHPKWNGQPIPTKTLLVYTEEGEREAVQLARYLPMAAARCGKLIVVCASRVAPLIATLAGIAEIRSAGQITVDEFDELLPLGSMPSVFGTTLETIPEAAPYFDLQILRRRKGEAARTSPNSRERRIGIVWSGSKKSPLDPAPTVPLEQWGPILRSPGVTFTSLQDEDRSDERCSVAAKTSIAGLATHIADHGDLALRIAELDLVVTIDAVAAHVAGAIGKPVWTLLGPSPHWRWGITGETTPWYPSMRLFRGDVDGDWTDVIARVAQSLAP